MDAHCANCKFFNHQANGAGECRKRAPLVLHVPEVERLTQEKRLRSISYWPPINGIEWCGEFEPDFSS